MFSGKSVYLLSRLIISSFFVFFVVMPAYAGDKKFNTDVYVAVSPIPEEPEYLAIHYSPIDSIVIEKSALGPSGIKKLDKDLFIDAPAFRAKLSEVFSNANQSFKQCGAEFQLRDIYIIDVNQKDIKRNFEAADNELAINVIDGKSQLLIDFEAATKTNTDSFKVLMGDLSDTGGERGRATDDGNISTVHMANAMNPLARGQILVHEFGHNLGLGHVEGANPLEHAMSDKQPDRDVGRGHNVVSKNQITEEGCETVKKNLSQYSQYEVKTGSAATLTSAMSSSSSKTKKSKAKPRSKPAPKKPKKTKTEMKKAKDHGYAPRTSSETSQYAVSTDEYDFDMPLLHQKGNRSRDPISGEPRVSFSAAFDVGQLNRPDTFLPLRYETDGVIDRFFPVDRDNTTAYGYTKMMQIALFDWISEAVSEGIAPFGLYSLRVSNEYLEADQKTRRELIESENQRLAILSPLDDNSGYSVGGAGFAHISNYRFEEEYWENKVFLLLEIFRKRLNDAHFSVRVGGMIGENKEKSELGYSTNSFIGDLEVWQTHIIRTDRYAAVLNSELSMPINDYISFEFEGEIRGIKNKLDAKSVLTINSDNFNVKDIMKFSDDEHDEGYKVGVGVKISPIKNFSISARANLEQWEIGVLQYPIENVSLENAPAGITWKERKSWAISIGAILDI